MSEPRLPKAISYEESKALAQDADPGVRRALAHHPDTKPEVLYFLAEDADAGVRRAIAENDRTPRQADLLLTGDSEVAIREALAEKVKRLTPALSAGDKDAVYDATVRVLETLARDQVVKIRTLVAEALKDIVDAPAHVIRALAQDSEIAVSGPVLQFSPVLTDADLLSIIRSGAVQDALAAISRRSVLREGVADAVVEFGDERTIAILLANGSAQIREETLDALVERAAPNPSWHAPLVSRPILPANAARLLAGFVARALLDRLRARTDLPADVVEAVAEAVSERLQTDEDAGADDLDDSDWADDQVSEADIDALHDQGRLTPETILDAAEEGRKRFAEMALAKCAGVGRKTATRAVAQKSAKGLLALSWKAGLTPSQAVAIQVRLGGLPPGDALGGGDGDAGIGSGGWPLSDEDMEWQLEFFGE